jgi:AbrB family looped-hinge helix DNA binding protein
MLTFSKKYGILTVGNHTTGGDKMIVKVSSKHQVTIPKDIADAFDLKKGDIVDIERHANKIIMTPKEVIFEDKYSKEDLIATEKALSKGLPNEEIAFKSGDDMVKYFKARIKK